MVSLLVTGLVGVDWVGTPPVGLVVATGVTMVEVSTDVRVDVVI